MPQLVCSLLAMTTHAFNPTILREYDIRGIVGDTLTEADAYALGRSFAAKAHGEGARTIAVGRDGRTHSGMLEAELIRGLNEGGVDVVQVGMGPSPMLISRPIISTSTAASRSQAVTTRRTTTGSSCC